MSAAKELVSSLARVPLDLPVQTDESRASLRATFIAWARLRIRTTKGDVQAGGLVKQWRDSRSYRDGLARAQRAEEAAQKKAARMQAALARAAAEAAKENPRRDLFPTAEWEYRFWEAVDRTHGQKRTDGRPPLQLDNPIRRSLWTAAIDIWRTKGRPPEEVARFACVACSVYAEPLRMAPVAAAQQQPRQVVPPGVFPTGARSARIAVPVELEDLPDLPTEARACGCKHAAAPAAAAPPPPAAAAAPPAPAAPPPAPYPDPPGGFGLTLIERDGKRFGRVKVIYSDPRGDIKWWFKVVKAIDRSKRGGWALEGESLRGGAYDLPIGSVVVENEPSGSKRSPVAEVTVGFIATYGGVVWLRKADGALYRWSAVEPSTLDKIEAILKWTPAQLEAASAARVAEVRAEEDKEIRTTPPTMQAEAERVLGALRAAGYGNAGVRLRKAAGASSLAIVVYSGAPGLPTERFVVREAGIEPENARPELVALVLGAAAPPPAAEPPPPSPPPEPAAPAPDAAVQVPLVWRQILALNPVDVPVSTLKRGGGRKEFGEALRDLFRDLGLRPISVTMPRGSMIFSIDVRVPDLRAPEALRKAYWDVAMQPTPPPTALTPYMELRKAVSERLKAIISRGFPDHGDRSDSMTDSYDYRWDVDFAEMDAPLDPAPLAAAPAPSPAPEPGPPPRPSPGRAWTKSAAQFQADLGVHQPHIAEISPMQYQRMGKAAQARYDKKRSAEWQASGDAKARWLEEVMAGYDQGLITLESSALHTDARRAIQGELLRRKEAGTAAALAAAHAANGAPEATALKIGDRLWDTLTNGYVTVTKVNTKSVNIKLKSGKEFNRDIRLLKLLSPVDVELRLKEGAPPPAAPAPEAAQEPAGAPEKDVPYRGWRFRRVADATQIGYRTGTGRFGKGRSLSGWDILEPDGERRSFAKDLTAARKYVDMMEGAPAAPDPPPAAPEPPAAAEPPAGPVVLAEGVRLERAAKLRRAADAMAGEVERDMNPATALQNQTARRARIADSMISRGLRAKRVQSTLYALAEAFEQSRYPHPLRHVESRAVVEDLLLRAALPAAAFPFSSLQELLEKVKGDKGLRAQVQIASKLRETNKDTGVIQLQGLEQIRAVDAIARKADGPGQYEAKNVRERTAPVLRLHTVGVDTEDEFQLAKAALEALSEPAAPSADQTIRKAERDLLGLKIPGYFPTPPAVVEQLLRKAELRPALNAYKILEPSAGKGDIAEAIRAAGVEPDVIELNSRLRDVLTLRGFHLVGEDFLAYNPGPVYDRVIGNPPFEDGQDGVHLQHAYELLKPGGRVVFVMGEGLFHQSTQKAEAFRAWLDELGGASEKLPAGSFAKNNTTDRTTSVAARIVVVDKPEVRAAAAPPPAPEPAPPPPPAPRRRRDMIDEVAVQPEPTPLPVRERPRALDALRAKVKRLREQEAEAKEANSKRPGMPTKKKLDAANQARRDAENLLDKEEERQADQLQRAIDEEILSAWRDAGVVIGPWRFSGAEPSLRLYFTGGDDSSVRVYGSARQREGEPVAGSFWAKPIFEQNPRLFEGRSFLEALKTAADTLGRGRFLGWSTGDDISEAAYMREHNIKMAWHQPPGVDIAEHLHAGAVAQDHPAAPTVAVVLPRIGVPEPWVIRLNMMLGLASKGMAVHTARGQWIAGPVEPYTVDWEDPQLTVSAAQLAQLSGAQLMPSAAAARAAKITAELALKRRRIVRSDGKIYLVDFNDAWSDLRYGRAPAAAPAAAQGPKVFVEEASSTHLMATPEGLPVEERRRLQDVFKDLGGFPGRSVGANYTYNFVGQRADKARLFYRLRSEGFQPIESAPPARPATEPVGPGPQGRREREALRDQVMELGMPGAPRSTQVEGLAIAVEGGNDNWKVTVGEEQFGPFLSRAAVDGVLADAVEQQLKFPETERTARGTLEAERKKRDKARAAHQAARQEADRDVAAVERGKLKALTPEQVARAAPLPRGLWAAAEDDRLSIEAGRPLVAWLWLALGVDPERADAIAEGTVPTMAEDLATAQRYARVSIAAQRAAERAGSAAAQGAANGDEHAYREGFEEDARELRDARVLRGLTTVLARHGRRSTFLEVWDRWKPTGPADSMELDKVRSFADLRALLEERAQKAIVPNAKAYGVTDSASNPLSSVARSAAYVDPVASIGAQAVTEAAEAARKARKKMGTRAWDLAVADNLEPAKRRAASAFLRRAAADRELLAKWLSGAREQQHVHASSWPRSLREKAADLEALDIAPATVSRMHAMAADLQGQILRAKLADQGELPRFDSAVDAVKTYLANLDKSAEDSVEPLAPGVVDKVPRPRPMKAPVGGVPKLVKDPAWLPVHARAEKSEGHHFFVNTYEWFSIKDRGRSVFCRAPAENPVVNKARLLGRIGSPGEPLSLAGATSSSQVRPGATILQGAYLLPHLRLAQWAASTDVTRLHMNGILLAPGEVVAVNGHVLVRVRFSSAWPLLDPEERAGTLLPLDLCDAALKTIKDKDDLADVGLCNGGREIFIAGDTAAVRCARPDGEIKFPPYNQVIPDASGYGRFVFTVNRETFLRQVRAAEEHLRGKGVSGSDLRDLEEVWRLAGCPGPACQLLANVVRPPQGPGVALKVPAKADKDRAKPTGFNSSYVYDAVFHAPGEDVQISLGDVLDPLRLDAGPYTAVIMPKRL